MAQASADVETSSRCYGRREPWVQRFEEVKDYQAGRWPHPRRVVAKVERTPQGSPRRFVVTNRTQRPDAVYQDVSVQRGAVPAQPLGERNNGLGAERRSACGFCANAGRLLVPGVASALVVLFREANADVPAVARAEGSTLRQRLWKVPAVVATSARRVVVRLSAGWPVRERLGRVVTAVAAFAGRLARGPAGGVAAAPLPR